MIIADGSHLLHRCRYNAPETSRHEYCRMFCNLFLAVLKTLGERQAVVCWNFKGSRRKRTASDIEDAGVKQEYLAARKWLHCALPKLGFCSLMAEGIETGDVAHWLISSKLTEPDRDVNYLISADKNWLQLITERWHVYSPLFGETVTDVDFCRKHRSKPYYNMKRALLGSQGAARCYGVDENNVDRWAEKLVTGADLIGANMASVHVNEFLASGRLTRNLEALELGALCRGERRYLHKKYADCRARVEQPALSDWIAAACEIEAPSLILYGMEL